VIPASVRILVCREPVDLRRSFDGLALSARQVLGEEPQSGALFCFVNKRANRLKRLHRARFRLPGDASGSGPSLRIDGAQLAHLLTGVAQEQRQRRSR
jgi:transposase